MSELSKAIAARHATIGNLQIEIEALSRAERILAPTRGVTQPATPEATAKAKAKTKAQATRKRPAMTAAQKKAVSIRMKAYWAKRNRKKTVTKGGK